METHELDDESYRCFTCNAVFRGRVFEIAREWERTHFSSTIPEVEIVDAYGLECYCSQTCLDARRDMVMAAEAVPIRRVDGIGPVNPCANCGGPVDMTEFHLAYAGMCSDMRGAMALTVDVDYLAVLCKKCHPYGRTYRACTDIEAPVVKAPF